MAANDLILQLGARRTRRDLTHDYWMYEPITADGSHEFHKLITFIDISPEV